MVRKILIPFCLLLALLTGCRSDEPFDLPGAEETGVRLLIPSATMAKETATRTRAFENHTSTHDILEAEGTINNIHVFGFLQNGAGGSTPAFYQELTEEMGTPVNDIYRSYNIAATPGTYNIYILANASLPASLTNPATVAESKVKDAALNMPQIVKLNPTKNKYLPMSGTATCEVRPRTTATAYANLSFLNAKVRFTVINENGFSDLVRYERISGKTFMSYVNLFKDNPENPSTSILHGSLMPEIQSFSQTYKLLDSFKGLDDATKLEALLNAENGNLLLDKFTTDDILADEYEKNFIYQGICYLPETLGATSKDNKPFVNLVYSVDNSNKNQEFFLGDDCDATTPYDPKVGGPDLKRSHFYDIVVRIKTGGDVLVYWDVTEWTNDKVDIQLAGLTNLFLQKTLIEETMTGESVEYVGFSTNAPRLTLVSDEDNNGVPYFLLHENRADGTISVRVNPALSNGDYTNKKFTVSAGNVTKSVYVKAIHLEDYLNITPRTQTHSVQSFINEKFYDFYFDYSTNLSDLSLKMTAFNNDNTKKNYVASEEENRVGRGLYIELCKNDSTPVTRRIDYNDFKTNSSFNFNSFLNAGESLPSSGLIRVVIETPSDAEYFSKEITGTFEGTAGSFKKNGKFTVVPNPAVYTIHFKAINGGDWSKPHIYVYQPLEYQGYPVFGHAEKSPTINWIEYSFTGNLGFKGWAYQDGVVPNLDSKYFKTGSDKIDFGGEKWDGYQLDSEWGDPVSSFNDSRYKKDFNFIDTSELDCGSCKGEIELTWPGCCMVEEGNGWWKIELPLLAKPDKAMIMFSGGHRSGSRYPGENAPGIPLPNYSDREAWYLYDNAIGGENCYFSDDKMESYPAEPVDYYVISWATNSDGKNKLCMFNKTQPFGDFNAVKGGSTVDKGSGQTIGGYQYVWARASLFLNGELKTDQGYQYLLLNGNGDKTSSGDLNFDSSHASEVTLSATDLQTLTNKIKATEGDRFGSIVKIYRVKSN